MSSSRSPINRMMGALVPRAVDALDPDELLERLDLDAVLARVDLNQLLDRLDLDAVLSRIDLDNLMTRIDVDALIGRVDVNRLVSQVDVNALVAQVDVDVLMQKVDVNGLVSRVDVNGLVNEVDVNHLVGQVDVGELVSRVDVNELVGTLDVDSLVGRVDLNSLMNEVDVASLVARAGIDQIVADATGGMAARTLDLARRQLLRMDLVFMALIDKLTRRPSSTPAPGFDSPTRLDREARGSLAAGPVSRTVAFVVDSMAVSATFGLAVSIGGFLLGLFTTRDISQVDGRGSWWTVAFLAWWFTYLWLTVGVGGRTMGKGLVGLRVTRANGTEMTLGSAAVRAAVLPASMILGLGFIPAVLGAERRALHDLAAGSRVNVDWGPRPVTLPASWSRPDGTRAS